MIAFFHGGSDPISAAIRWQTRGPYSHAAWLRQDGSIMEAWMVGGVQHNDSPFVLHSPECTFDVFDIHGLTHNQRAAIEEFILRQCGAGYDWFGVARFLSHVNRNNMHRWFCSELVAEAAEMAHVPLMMTDAWRISPSALAWSTELRPVQMKVGRAWWEQFYGRRAILPSDDRPTLFDELENYG